MSSVPVPLSYHHRTETQSITVGGPVPDGADMRAVTAERKMCNRICGLLQLDPSRNFGRLEAEDVGVGPPRRTEHSAGDGWEDGSDDPSLV